MRFRIVSLAPQLRQAFEAVEIGTELAAGPGMTLDLDGLPLPQ